jgi:2-keto-4-pentenoate hydratase/2-oxohepta-3-ene-1,7-dioic acid hydratase in catechol pathway
MTSRLGPCEGKDFANGLGPYIVTPDEIARPYELLMTARVNGVEWSRGATNTMNYSFEEAIAQFSLDAPLVAGEVIGSGTVLSGCGLEQGRQLQPNDIVELEVEGLGVLANRVVRAAVSSAATA